MLTIFTIPKPFIDRHISIIQTNAINSWKRLIPEPEIILFGDENGIEENAKKLGVLSYKNIEKNEFGTPYLDFVFVKAKEISKYNTVCYINCDIILFQDFFDTIKRVAFKKFFLIGQRWDIDIVAPIDFLEIDIDKKLKLLQQNSATLQGVAAMDYFVFTKKDFKFMPRFLVGRAGWDNWMVYYFKKNRIPSIDCTNNITSLHQNHDYRHIKHNNSGTYLGIESDYNLKIINKRIFLSVKDTDYYLTSGENLIKRKKNLKKSIDYLELFFPIIYHILKFPYTIFKIIFKKKINLSIF